MSDDEKLARLNAELRKNAVEIARLTGELIHRSEHVSVQLLLTPEYLELRNALIRALAAYPEARRAVAAVLQQHERETSRPAPRVIESAAASQEVAGDAVSA